MSTPCESKFHIYQGTTELKIVNFTVTPSETLEEGKNYSKTLGNTYATLTVNSLPASENSKVVFDMEASADVMTNTGTPLRRTFTGTFTINKLSNSAPNILVDAANDNVNIPCDSNGVVTAGFPHSNYINVFEGATQLDIENVTCADSNVVFTSNENTITVTKINNWNESVYPVTFTVKPVGKAARQVTVRYIKVVPGAEGQAAQFYELNTNLSSIKVDNTGKVINDKLKVNLLHRVGAETTIVELKDKPSTLNVYYSIDGGVAKTFDSTGELDLSNAIKGELDLDSYVELTLKDGDKVIDGPEKLYMVHDGAVGKVFRLSTNNTVIKVNNVDEIENTSDIVVSIFKVDGDEVTEISITDLSDLTNDSYELYKSVDGAAATKCTNVSDMTITKNAMANIGSEVRYELRYVQSGQSEPVLIDSIVINVLRDGVKGATGKIMYYGGEWKSGTLYEAEETSTPYVYDSTGKDGYNYFFLVRDNNEKIKTTSPYTDWSNNKTSKLYTWKPIPSYEAIYANVGLFNTANVGPAVFYGDYVFSQSDINGSTTNYKNFDGNPLTGPHKPAVWFNFVTGAGSVARGNITWDHTGSVTFGPKARINWNTNIDNKPDIPDVSELESQMSDYETSLSGLNTTLDSLSGNVTQQGKDIEAAKTSITTAQTSLTTRINEVNTALTKAIADGDAALTTQLTAQAQTLQSQAQTLQTLNTTLNNIGQEGSVLSPAKIAELALTAAKGTSIDENAVKSGLIMGLVGEFGSVKAANISGDTIEGKTIKSTGDKWFIGKDGDGKLANGNITWNANGKVTFGEDVELKWGNIVDAPSIDGEDSKVTAIYVETANYTSSSTKYLWTGNMEMYDETSDYYVWVDESDYDHYMAGDYVEDGDFYNVAFTDKGQSIAAGDTVIAAGNCYYSEGVDSWYAEEADEDITVVRVDSSAGLTADDVTGIIKNTEISANQIRTGTINANLVKVTNIDASNITTGKIGAKLIDADNITVSKLDTKPSQTDTTGKITIEGNDMIIYNRSSVNPAIKISGDTLPDLSSTAPVSPGNKSYSFGGAYAMSSSGTTIESRKLGSITVNANNDLTLSPSISYDLALEWSDGTEYGYHANVSFGLNFISSNQTNLFKATMDFSFNAGQNNNDGSGIVLTGGDLVPVIDGNSGFTLLKGKTYDIYEVYFFEFEDVDGDESELFVNFGFKRYETSTILVKTINIHYEYHTPTDRISELGNDGIRFRQSPYEYFETCGNEMVIQDYHQAMGFNGDGLWMAVAKGDGSDNVIIWSKPKISNGTLTFGTSASTTYQNIRNTMFRH